MTAIVILGAAVWADGPSPTLRRRVAHGAALFHAGRGDVVVVCGGLGRHPPTEAEAMAALLRKANVPDGAILREARSTNTRENLAFALPLLQARGIHDVVIVSDGYHLPRAKLIARRLGLNATGNAPDPSGTRVWPRIRGWLREGPGLAAVWFGLR